MATVIAGELEPAIQGILAGAKVGALMQELRLRHKENKLQAARVANETSRQLLDWTREADLIGHRAEREDLWQTQAQVALAASERQEATAATGSMVDLLQAGIDVTDLDFTDDESMALVENILQSPTAKALKIPSEEGNKVMWQQLAKGMWGQAREKLRIQELRAEGYAQYLAAGSALRAEGSDDPILATQLAGVKEQMESPTRILQILDLQEMSRIASGKPATPEQQKIETQLRETMEGRITKYGEQAEAYFEASRKRRAERRGAAARTPETEPSAEGAGIGLPTVVTDADYDSLLPGAEFVDEDGNRWRKPE